MARVFIEGSMAVAEGAALCRPDVISAYPITPQTHIVEDLAQFVADGKLTCEFVNTESEFGAASVVLGAECAGSRAYTATTSQGLILMSEVLFNVAGMRLPLVMCVANRSLSAPLSIWTDHQDIVTLRDSGFIIMFAEDAQEALDLHMIAYRVGEDKRVQLPVMINIDGFLITHTYEPVDVPEQSEVDKFLKPYVPFQALDPKKPYTMGAFTEPAYHMDVRYAMHKANVDSVSVIEEVSAEFEKQFGRKAGGLVQGYKLDDAETVLVAFGSITGLLEEAVDTMREKGQKVGILKIKTYRPFPFDAVRKALANRKRVIVLDRAMSAGFGEILGGDIRSALYGVAGQPVLDSYIYGLGGRDIFIEDVEKLVADPNPGTHHGDWIGVRHDILEEA